MQARKVTAKPGQVFFGAPIGVLMLDCVAPFVPGSVGNASTFSQPARYLPVAGLTVDRVLSPQAAESEAAVVAAAIELEQAGARLITANCGFTARFQDAVRSAVGVPVLLSSLLLAPFLDRMIPANKALGIATASKAALSPDFLASVGVSTDPGRVAVVGLDEAPEFTTGLITCVGEMDVARVSDEVVSAVTGLVAERPDVCAILLECSEFPAYASAVQQATGLPVFDFVSMIEFFVGGLTRTPYGGLM